MSEECCASCVFWKSRDGYWGKCVIQRPPKHHDFGERYTGEMDACSEWEEEPEREYWGADAKGEGDE